MSIMSYKTNISLSVSFLQTNFYGVSESNIIVINVSINSGILNAASFGHTVNRCISLVLLLTSIVMAIFYVR